MPELSKFAYPIFLFSNAFAIWVFFEEKKRWFLAQTVIFFTINIIGLNRWLL